MPAGTVYWVSPTGTRPGRRPGARRPLSGTACCSLATANANAAAGTRSYLRGGTYEPGIRPLRLGRWEPSSLRSGLFRRRSPSSRWTRPAGDGPSSRAKATSRWTGSELRISGAFFFIGYGSSYNEIANCTFDAARATISSGSSRLDSSSLRPARPRPTTTGSTTIRSRGTGHRRRARTGPGRPDQPATIPMTRRAHNTFEDNVFFYGGHDCIDIGGRYNVVRNNVFHNEDAYFEDVDAESSATSRRAAISATGTSFSRTPATTPERPITR